MTAVAVDPLAVLNRLLEIVYRSFPMYLRFAHPWSAGDSEQAREKLEYIAQDHEVSAKRLARAIDGAGGFVDYGDFPAMFADWNDLSLKFLVGKALELQRKDIDVIAAAAEELRGQPRYRALAEEVLGTAKAHLATLESLAETV